MNPLKAKLISHVNPVTLSKISKEEQNGPKTVEGDLK